MTGARSLRRIAAIALLAAMTAACNERSIFDPAGPAARTLSRLGWFVLGTFIITTIFMWILIWYVGYRRRGTLAEHEPADAEGGLNWVLIGGFTIPAAVLAIIFVVTLQSMAAFPISDHHPNADIRVLGHQWWFEVEYRIGRHDQWVTSATEIHIPVGRPVEIALETRDVIHSFWVPRLHGKVDLMPGMVNHIRLQADAPGRYEGQCSEFCGKQHANMRIVVFAQQPEAFEQWLDAQRRPADSPASPAAASGKQLFERTACALCHTVRGTPALGRVGPDLTHIASRDRIAGGMLENNVANLHAWVTHAQSLKPGSQMPDLTQYNGAELHEIVDYLQSLR
jgi:cytochrome c oxidase subunit 2